MQDLTEDTSSSGAVLCCSGRDRGYRVPDVCEGCSHEDRCAGGPCVLERVLRRRPAGCVSDTCTTLTNHRLIFLVSPAHLDHVMGPLWGCLCRCIHVSCWLLAWLNQCHVQPTRSKTGSRFLAESGGQNPVPGGAWPPHRAAPRDSQQLVRLRWLHPDSGFDRA